MVTTDDNTATAPTKIKDNDADVAPSFGDNDNGDH